MLSGEAWVKTNRRANRISELQNGSNHPDSIPPRCTFNRALQCMGNASIFFRNDRRLALLYFANRTFAAWRRIQPNRASVRPVADTQGLVPARQSPLIWPWFNQQTVRRTNEQGGRLAGLQANLTGKSPPTIGFLLTRLGPMRNDNALRT